MALQIFGNNYILLRQVSLVANYSERLYML